MRSNRSRLASCLALLLLSGCTGAAPGPTTPTTGGPGAVTGDWDGVGDFADAVMAEDASRAAPHAAAGSPAARYLTFQSDFVAADPAHAKPNPATWAVAVDKHLGVVTIKLDDGSALTWTDWRFDATGKILQWSTPTAGPLEKRLWTARPSASAAQGTIAVSSGLVNDASLNIVLGVCATGTPLVPDCDATYAAASGTPAKPVGCLAPTSVPANGTAKVALQYAGAAFGGTLSYALKDAAGATLGTLRLTVT